MTTTKAITRSGEVVSLTTGDNHTLAIGTEGDPIVASTPEILDETFSLSELARLFEESERADERTKLRKAILLAVGQFH